MCCSAIKRTDIRLRMAPSKKLLICVGDMYLAHSWKLARYDGHAGANHRMEKDEPLGHGRNVIPMSLYQLAELGYKGRVLFESRDKRVVRQELKALSVGIERL